MSGLLKFEGYSVYHRTSKSFLDKTDHSPLHLIAGKKGMLTYTAAWLPKNIKYLQTLSAGYQPARIILTQSFD
jgi:hypothetical protein